MGFASGKIEKVLIPHKPPILVLTIRQLPLNLVLLKNIEITGIHWGAYASTCSLSCKIGDMGEAHVSFS